MKFSIVTPSYNSERFIAGTIESVITQAGDFQIEYILIDGGSTDSTVSIIKKYAEKVKSDSFKCNCNGVEIKYKSENDKGMYDAINKGFAVATGDVYAYINSDDIYLTGAFETIGKIFKSESKVQWLKGITSYIDVGSKLKKNGLCLLYDRKWISQGVYGRDAYFIQQDSVFWRAELWKKSGNIDSQFTLAGDYYLWVKFASFTPLYSVNTFVSCFREVSGQLSENVLAYMNEVETIVGKSKNKYKYVKYYLHYEKLLPLKVRKLLYKLLFFKQDLNLIEVGSKGNIVLSKENYYVAQSNRGEQ